MSAAPLTDAEMLVALVGAVCTRQAPPPVVTRWAARRLLDQLSPREREAARNVALRAAGACVSGSPWAKATMLRDESIQVADEWTLHAFYPPRPATIESHLVTALSIGDVPASLRQLLRIIEDD